MKIKVAVCDDSMSDLKIIVKIVENYFLERKIALEIQSFTSSEKFILNYTNYDFIILDILIHNQNGLDLAHIIHTKHPDTKIIYYSTELNFAPKTYDFYGYGFILKPANKQMVYACLDRVVKSLKQNFIVYKDTNGRSVQIDVNDIYYISSIIRYTTITSSNTTVETKLSMLEWKEKLKDFPFAECKRGTFVNLHVIKEIDEFKYVVLKNGKRLRLSERVGEKFVKLYTLYWSSNL